MLKHHFFAQPKQALAPSSDALANQIIQNLELFVLGIYDIIHQNEVHFIFET